MEAIAEGEFPDRGLFDVHTGMKGEARYANGVVVRSLVKEEQVPCVRFIGEDGWIEASRDQFSASNPALLRETPKGGIELRTSNNHHANYLESLRAGTDPVAPVEAGHRSNTVCLLHYFSMKLRRKIQWDPLREEIVNDPEASALMHYSYREGFRLPG